MTTKPIYTSQQIVQQLIGWGWHWDQPTVTYHVGNADAAQQTYLREAMALWDDVSDLDIKETADPSIADIGFDYWANPTDVIWEDADGTTLTIREVGIHFSAVDGWNQGQNLSYGSRGFTTMLHEIGHALGLDHPGDYGRDVSAFSPTYSADAEFQQDTQRSTVMSYFGASEDGSGASHMFYDGTGFGWVFPQTPMVYDVLALEARYGAETTTRTGNTVYGYNATADRAVYDFTQNASPVLTLYDNGGVDTLDLSGDMATRALKPVYGADGSVTSWQDASFGYERVIDLREGAYSSTHGMTANIGIAFGTVIENAVGTAYADIIHGNEVANVLAGGGGNDTISGNAGKDTLRGGSGSDVLIGGAGADHLDGGAGADWVSYATSDVGVVADFASPGLNTGHAAGDTYVSVEKLKGSDYADTLRGDSFANVIKGGSGKDWLEGQAGNDRLYGEKGNDALLGGTGKDALYGGGGSDTFYFTALSDSTTNAKKMDSIMDFSRGQGDMIDLSALDADASVAGNQAFTFMGAQTFTGAAGELIFDATRISGATVVLADVDGDWIADFGFLLAGAHDLLATDFIL